MAWSLEEAISYYKRQGAPADQTAVVNLLWEVQTENGGSIPLPLLAVIAQGLGTKENFLQAIIRRIPRLRLGDQHTLELCAGPNCGKHASLAKAAQALADQSRGKILLKFVPCMRMCGKGPNIKWDGRVIHGAIPETLAQLTEE